MKKEDMKLLLNEGFISTVMLYSILKRLCSSWNSWPACKLGIIDKDGNKIKGPKTSEEKESWTYYDIFIWNIKRTLQKFVGKNNLGYYLTTTFLLRDSMKPLNSSNILLEYESYKEFDDYSFKRNQIIHEIHKNFPIKVEKKPSSFLECETIYINNKSKIDKYLNQYDLNFLTED